MWIFAVEENHVIVNIDDKSRTEKFGHVTVESIDNLEYLEESIAVFGDILFLPKIYAISNFLKPLPCNCSTNKVGLQKTFIYITENKSWMMYPGRREWGSKDSTNHIIWPLSTTYILRGLVTHLNKDFFVIISSR